MAVVSSGAHPRGRYFEKAVYADEPPLGFEQARPLLPQPLHPARPDLIDCYWTAWEIAYRNVHTPAAESGFVSNFIDAAFSENIFEWDTCLITIFCNLAHPYIPGIRSLDNFYCKQHENGEICREIVAATGEDCPEFVNAAGAPLHSSWHNREVSRNFPDHVPPGLADTKYAPDLGEDTGIPNLTLDALNHPILAWAELESYRHTGDRDRLASVVPPLVRYYEALRHFLRDRRTGLYATDWSSMDNSPRTLYVAFGVDTSCEMVMFARQLLELADLAGRPDLIDAERLRSDAEATAAAINEHMWCPEQRYYFDLKRDRTRGPAKTIAAFWTLLAGVAGPEQAEALVQRLEDPAVFARRHMVPTIPADEPFFNPYGGYWQGAVWAPTNTMVIRGLEQYGYDELAGRIAINHLENVAEVFRETGTIWENYSADHSAPGDLSAPGFVGWSGLGPILYLIERVIGLRGDAARDEIVWTLPADHGEIGCSRYWFAGRTLDLRATKLANGSTAIELESTAPVAVSIRIDGRRTDLVAGERTTVELEA